MGGGLLQLVAYGAQDIYLTGNPQVTFFKVVYRRHTNFAIEARKQTIKGDVGPGNVVNSVIDRSGDLIGRMYLEFQVHGSSGERFSANPGSAIIDKVELQIGGQTIDTHYGHWLEVWAELNEDNETGRLGVMDGNGVLKNGTTFQNMSFMGGVHATNSDFGSTPKDSLKFDVPLAFWFCRNIGSALPIMALQYHEVKLWITFGTDYMGKTGPAVQNTRGFDCELWADYVYLDTDERRRFAQVSHEYLIEQLQFIKSDTSKKVHELTFKHPVKELIFTGGVTEPYDYSGTTGPSTPKTLVTSPEEQTVKLELNGQDRFEARHIRYFTRTQVWEHHRHGVGGIKISDQFATLDSIGIYSFALRPEEHQPSGTCNFSRIKKANLVLGVAGALYIYAVNYNVLRIMSGMGGVAYVN